MIWLHFSGFCTVLQIERNAYVEHFRQMTSELVHLLEFPRCTMMY